VNDAAIESFFANNADSAAVEAPPAVDAGVGGKKTTLRRKYVNLPEQFELFQDPMENAGVGGVSNPTYGSPADDGRYGSHSNV
jgi:hypothetical protein